jgi:hypothetical protein
MASVWVTSDESRNKTHKSPYILIFMDRNDLLPSENSWE